MTAHEETPTRPASGEGGSEGATADGDEAGGLISPHCSTSSPHSNGINTTSDESAIPCCVCGTATRVVRSAKGRTLVACDSCECEFWTESRSRAKAGRTLHARMGADR
jgi:hypothetical protein